MIQTNLKHPFTFPFPLLFLLLKSLPLLPALELFQPIFHCFCCGVTSIGKGTNQLELEQSIFFLKLWSHTFSRFFIVFRLLLYGWHIGHCNRGIQGGHFQLWEFIQLPPGVHSTFSILLLGMRPSPRHFYPKHRHTGVPLPQVRKSWLHNQVSGFFKKGNIMFWKVLQIACNGYYRH